MCTLRSLFKQLPTPIILGSIFVGLTQLSPYDAQAKIYTYERDGVIVISSEPPPKFSRPKRSRRTRQLPQKSRTQKNVKSSYKRSKKSRPKRNQTSRRKVRKRSSTSVRRSPWKPPKSLTRYRKHLKRAAQHYQLPHRLLWSVISACQEIKRLKLTLNDPEAEPIKQQVTCMSSQVIDVLSEELSTQISPRTHRSTRHRQRARQFFAAAAILRRLINYYRGDVTLVLSAYPYAAHWTQHPVFSTSSRTLNSNQLLSLNDVKQSTTSAQRTQPPHQTKLRFAYLLFSRKAIALYHRLLEEKA